MYEQKLETLPPPPGVLGSLKAGFDVVSSNVLLILIPFVLDLFLWLGPRLGVSKVMGPIYGSIFEQVRRGLTSPDDIKRLITFRDLFNEGLERFNLVSLTSRLQTFPIGISSLLAKTMPMDSPLGNQNMMQASSSLAVLAYMFVLVLFGWLIGGLYF